MSDDNESGIWLFGKSLEKPFHGLDATCRGTDAHDGKSYLVGHGHP
jgi:hypothetical protein